MKKSYSSLHRILHWSIAFAMLFMLFTIFLRLNWMSKYNMADILTQQLTELNLKVDKDQSITVAKAIRKPMWNWHVYTGYLLIGLYSARMLFFVTKGIVFANPFSKDISTRRKFQSWVYIGFYICLGLSLVSGALIALGPESYEDAIEPYHKLSIYWLLTYMALHLFGIMTAEFGKGKGIVSRMISGDRS